MTDQTATIRIRLDPSGAVTGSQKAAQAIGQIGATAKVSAGQTANAMRQLPAQFTDIATQLAGGQSPFLILLQQGGQIRDSFGGVGASLRGIASLISPVKLAVGGLAAGVGALGFAALAGAKESAKLRDTLILTGNAAGLTEDRLGNLSETLAARTGQTLGSARELVTQLAATGRVSAAVLESTATAVGRIATLSGEATEQIAGRFTRIMREPAKVAAELNDQYNFLTVELAKRIRQLDDEGRKAEAANLVNTSLTQALEGQRRELGFLEVAWVNAKKAADSFWQGLQNVGRPDTAGALVDRQQRVVDGLRRELEQQPEVNALGMPNTGRTLALQQLEFAETYLRDLQQIAREEERVAAAAAKRAESGLTVRDILTDRPDGKAAKFLRDQALLASGGVSGFNGNEFAAETERLARYEEQLAALPPVFSAVMTAREAMVSDFLRSEKAQYAETDKFLADIKERADEQLRAIAERQRQNVQDAFGDSLTRAIEGDFDSIGDLWKNLISRMAAEAISADLTAALFGRGQGGNLASLFGNIFGMFDGARADGGPVSGGRTYLVGERGPELFTPNVSGAIIPNGAGGMSITLAPRISIDARSDQAQVAQLVAAGMQQAKRSMFAELKARGVA